MTECFVCGTDITSSEEGNCCQICSTQCHNTCMGGALRVLRGNVNTYYPGPVCRTCVDTEQATQQAEQTEQAAAAEQVTQ